MWNFNHERLGIIIQANRFARVCIEESIKVHQLDLGTSWEVKFNTFYSIVCKQERDVW